jgi:hypothetical protein
MIMHVESKRTLFVLWLRRVIRFTEDALKADYPGCARFLVLFWFGKYDQRILNISSPFFFFFWFGKYDQRILNISSPFFSSK